MWYTTRSKSEHTPGWRQIQQTLVVLVCIIQRKTPGTTFLSVGFLWASTACIFIEIKSKCLLFRDGFVRWWAHQLLFMNTPKDRRNIRAPSKDTTVVPKAFSNTCKDDKHLLRCFFNAITAMTFWRTSRLQVLVAQCDCCCCCAPCTCVESHDGWNPVTCRHFVNTSARCTTTAVGLCHQNLKKEQCPQKHLRCTAIKEGFE